MTLHIALSISQGENFGCRKGLDFVNQDLAQAVNNHMPVVDVCRQDAVQAAISEKDATIALLEMTSTKKQRNLEEIEHLTHEKHRLQASLREVVGDTRECARSL